MKYRNCFWFSFGDLKVGESFVFCNPFTPSDSDSVDNEKFLKISPRKYRVLTGHDAGREWQTTSKTSVKRI